MLVVWEQKTWVLLYSPCYVYYVPIYLFVHSPSVRNLGFLSIWSEVRSLTHPKISTLLLTYLTEETIAACELSP
jgi:hypothetical protein